MVYLFQQSVYLKSQRVVRIGLLGQPLETSGNRGFQSGIGLKDWDCVGPGCQNAYTASASAL